MPFHLNSSDLGEGSVIQPGNWGRIIRLYGWGHGRAMLEAAMEEVRRLEFEQLPSRMECAFYFDDLAEAKFYQSTDQSRLLMIIYEVEVADQNAIQHRTDWRNIGASGNINLDWARRYWSGAMNAPIDEHTCQEVLATTPLKILRRAT